jgi:hypothetical protein
MKIFKHVPNPVRYLKINLDHCTYMRKNGDILPPNYNFTTFLRSTKASSTNFESKFFRVQEELTVEINEVVVIQRNYKILRLEYVVTL